MGVEAWIRFVGVRGVGGGASVWSIVAPTVASGPSALASMRGATGRTLAGCETEATTVGVCVGTLAGGTLAGVRGVIAVVALAGGALAGGLWFGGSSRAILVLDEKWRDRAFQVREAITSFMMVSACSKAVVDIVEVGTWASVHPCTHLPVIWNLTHIATAEFARPFLARRESTNLGHFRDPGVLSAKRSR